MANIPALANTTGKFLNNAQDLFDPKTYQDGLDGGIKASPVPLADSGLPFTTIPPKIQITNSKRQLIQWFIPQLGTVKMFVNPENIQYSFRKIIRSNRTKGGYNLQYWGEELPTLSIRGTTGSSGIEGINALYEVYRSEQYTFDAVGNKIAASEAEASASSVLGGVLGTAFSTLTFGSNFLENFVGSFGNDLTSTSGINLANNAFTIEMFYMGWVFRGFFNSMDFTESSDNFLLSYNISFTVTQRRGYRTNYFPWHKSPAQGGSNFGTHFQTDDYSRRESLLSEYGTVATPQDSFTSSNRLKNPNLPITNNGNTNI